MCKNTFFSISHNSCNPRSEKSQTVANTTAHPVRIFLKQFTEKNAYGHFDLILSQNMSVFMKFRNQMLQMLQSRNQCKNAKKTTKNQPKSKKVTKKKSVKKKSVVGRKKPRSRRSSITHCEANGRYGLRSSKRSKWLWFCIRYHNLLRCIYDFFLALRAFHVKCIWHAKELVVYMWCMEKLLVLWMGYWKVVCVSKSLSEPRFYSNF